MPNKKALVVAIDDYGGPPNNLPSCIADGNAISRLLQSSYNTVSYTHLTLPTTSRV